MCGLMGGGGAFHENIQLDQIQTCRLVAIINFNMRNTLKTVPDS